MRIWYGEIHVIPLIREYFYSTLILNRLARNSLMTRNIARWKSFYEKLFKFSYTVSWTSVNITRMRRHYSLKSLALLLKCFRSCRYGAHSSLMNETWIYSLLNMMDFRPNQVLLQITLGYTKTEEQKSSLLIMTYINHHRKCRSLCVSNYVSIWFLSFTS